MRSRPVSGTIALAILVALTACSSDDDGTDESTTSTDGAVEVTVAALEIADYAPAYYAAEHGLFEAEGLDVTITTIQGGADSVPLLVSGQADIAVTGWISYVMAVGENLPINAVLPGAEGAPDFTSIVALPGSGISAPTDLEGRTVAVNNLRAVAELTALVALEEAGVDTSTISFVELPFPDMGSALDTENIDAAWVVEPFQAGLLAQGAEVVVDVYGGELNGFPLGGWSATEEFATDNPDALDAFARAMSAAVEALDDDATFVEFLPSFTPLTAEQAQSVTLPVFQEAMTPEDLQWEADLMLEHGLVSEPVEVTATLDNLRELS